MSDKFVFTVCADMNRKGRCLGAEFGAEGGRSVTRFVRKDSSLAKWELRKVVEKVFLENFLASVYLNCDLVFRRTYYNFIAASSHFFYFLFRKQILFCFLFPPISYLCCSLNWGSGVEARLGTFSLRSGGDLGGANLEKALRESSGALRLTAKR